jgi:hypothetical protein
MTMKSIHLAAQLPFYSRWTWIESSLRYYRSSKLTQNDRGNDEMRSRQRHGMQCHYEQSIHFHDTAYLTTTLHRFPFPFRKVLWEANVRGWFWRE